MVKKPYSCSLLLHKSYISHSVTAHDDDGMKIRKSKSWDCIA